MEKLRRALPAVLGLVLFAVALVVLRKELHAVTWHELTSDVLATPAARLLAALLLTALNYAVLTGYDLLAFAYIGNALVALARGRGLVPRLRDRQQRRLRHALGRLRALPLLHALGRHRRGAVADRLLVLGHLLARPARAGRARASWRARFPAPTSSRRTSWSRPVGWLLLLTSVGLPRRRGRAARADPRLGTSSCRCRRRGSAFAQLARVGARLDARRRGALRAAAAERRCRSWACWARSWRRSSSGSPATCRAASASSRA